MAITGSINLMKYVGARKVSLQGENGVFIPVKQNPSLFVGDKGIYASLRIVEHESEYGGKRYSHFIAANLSKEARESLESAYGRDKARAFAPILGNANDYNMEGGGSFEEVSEDATPRSSTVVPGPATLDRADDGLAPHYEDLPF